MSSGDGNSPIQTVLDPAGKGLRFDPVIASALLGEFHGLVECLDSISKQGDRLVLVEGCGTFPSGIAVREALTSLGNAASQALLALAKAANECASAVQKAAQRTLETDNENNHVIKQSVVDSYIRQDTAHRNGGGRGRVPSTHSDASYDRTFEHYKSQINSPSTAKGWPPEGFSGGDYDPEVYNPKQIPGGASAGGYPTGAAPENTAGAILDMANAMLLIADSGKVLALAAAWRGIAQDLQLALSTFSSNLESTWGESWTGTAADAIRAGMSQFHDRGMDIGREMARVGDATFHFGTGIGVTKPGIVELIAERGSAVDAAAANPATAASIPSMNEAFEMRARSFMNVGYNPGVMTASGGMSYISDPQNPVAGAPLVVPGMKPPPAAPSTNGGSGPVSVGPGAGGGGGTRGGGGGASGGGGSGGSGGAGTLQRAATADPAALKNAATAGTGAGPSSGPSSAAAGDPASAAQSAMSTAKQGASGLTRGGLGDPTSTRSSGLGSLSAAEKAAAEKAAAAAKAGGGGGGGGAGKLGGGIGGGAAASESALSARGSAAMTSAERAMAAEQAALSNAKAGQPGTSAAPMGGRGAQAGGEGDGKHKTARYLRSTENGEEIVGELGEVAPVVLGGLNLDITDDSTPAPRTPRR